MRRKAFISGIAAAASVPAALKAAPAGDVIVTAETVHTVDPSGTTAQAFVVRNGRFAYVGSREGAVNFAGVNARRLDLGGVTVLPGLIDAHLHFMNVGDDFFIVQLMGSNSYEEVIRRTVEYAHRWSDPWITGDDWDQTRWPGQQFPTHEALTAALPDRPVVLYRVDGHALLANAKAMQLAGVTASTPEQTGGRIVRDAHGQPTGVFIDNAMELIDRAIPAPTHDQMKQSALAGQKECHRWGLTTIAEPGVDDGMLDAYRELLADGQLTMRNYAMLADNEQVIARHLGAGPVHLSYDGRLSVRAIKLFIDGAMGSRGAAMFEPYSDDPGNRGLLRITQAHIEDVAEKALRAGFQVCTHAIGDRGNRVTLDAYANALKRVPVRDHRFRTEHAQCLTAADIPRFAQLGVIPSMQTTHQVSDMRWALARLGPDRVKRAYAWRSLLDTGVVIPNGTDAPVEVVSTLRTFHAAITRQDETNSPAGGWHPEQRMTRDEALKSMTIWPAHANFMEGVAGSISVGKYADFTVLDRDWMNAAPEEIMSTRILGTYSSGHQVYEAPIATAYEPARRPRAARKGCCGRSTH